MTSRASRQLKRQIAERAGHRCEYCCSPSRFSTVPLAIDHIVPVAKGGKTDLDNLALACHGCNGTKYTCTEAFDEVAGIETTLFHPRRHKWTEHFDWDEDFAVMVAKTPLGRATILRLQLNRIEVVNLRRLLLLIGEHPPPLE